MYNDGLLTYGFDFWAIGLDDKKLLLSKSSSSSPNKPFFWLLNVVVVGLLTVCFVDLENLRSDYYSSSKRVFFFGCWLIGDWRGCFVEVFGNEGIRGPPRGPPKGWFDLVGSLGKNGPGWERGCICCFLDY